MRSALWQVVEQTRGAAFVLWDLIEGIVRRPSMRFASATISNAISFQTPGGVRVRVGPGLVMGMLFVAGAPLTREKVLGRWFYLAFSFVAKDRRIFLHRAMLGADDVWPQGHTTPSEHSEGGHAALMDHVTLESVSRLPIGDPGKFELSAKGAPVIMRFREMDNGLDAKLTIGSLQPWARNSPPHVTLAYHVPLQQLLFRGSVMHAMDEPPVKTPGVNSLRYLGSVDQPGVTRGYVVSDIDVDLEGEPPPILTDL